MTDTQYYFLSLSVLFNTIYVFWDTNAGKENAMLLTRWLVDSRHSEQRSHHLLTLSHPLGRQGGRADAAKRRTERQRPSDVKKAQRQCTTHHWHHMPVQNKESYDPKIQSFWKYLKKVERAWLAMHLPMRVLPVPGGPNNSSPLGGARIPVKISGLSIGSTMISRTYNTDRERL